MKRNYLSSSVRAAIASGIVLSAVAAPAALAGESLQEAISNGDTKLTLRYRYEEVDADNGLKDAEASTLKSRLTFTSAKFNDLQFQVEVDDVTQIGSDRYYHGADPATGKPATDLSDKGVYQVVADPEGTEVNQAWLAYTGLENTTIKYGRQRILLDNQRFIGGVGWRQNEQTYDALAVINTSLPDTTIIAGYVDNANRIWGDDVDASGKVINISNTSLPIGKLTAYAYLLDVTEASNGTLSSDTVGIRLTGNQEMDGWNLLYEAEYANQDEGDSEVASQERDVDYTHLVLGAKIGGVTAKIGQESFEAPESGQLGFFTPFATGHKFNGWADKFLAQHKLSGGLEDNYISVSGKLFGANVTAVYHDFEAESGGTDYGSEWDIAVAKKICDNTKVLVKYASYESDDNSAFTGDVDTDKLWVQLLWSY